MLHFLLLQAPRGQQPAVTGCRARLSVGNCMLMAPTETRSLLLHPPPPLCVLLHVLMYEQLLHASRSCQLSFTLRHVAAVSHSKAASLQSSACVLLCRRILKLVQRESGQHFHVCLSERSATHDMTALVSPARGAYKFAILLLEH